MKKGDCLGWGKADFQDVRGFFLMAKRPCRLFLGEPVTGHGFKGSGLFLFYACNSRLGFLALVTGVILSRHSLVGDAFNGGKFSSAAGGRFEVVKELFDGSREDLFCASSPLTGSLRRVFNFRPVLAPSASSSSVTMPPAWRSAHNGERRSWPNPCPAGRPWAEEPQP